MAPAESSWPGESGNLGLLVVGAGARLGAALPGFSFNCAGSFREVAVPADGVAGQLDAVVHPWLSSALTLDGFLLMQGCSAISSLVSPSAEAAYGSTRPRRMA
jgi:hypothetical protein